VQHEYQAHEKRARTRAIPDRFKQLYGVILGETGSGHEAREHIHISNQRNDRSDSSTSLRARSRSTAPFNSGNLAFPLYPHLGLHAHPQPQPQSEGARSPSHTRPQLPLPLLSPQHTSMSPSRAPQPIRNPYPYPRWRPQTPTPHTSRPPSPLVSGLESQAGEAPPYESVAVFGPPPTNGY
jgi:hypothetical protein